MTSVFEIAHCSLYTSLYLSIFKGRQTGNIEKRSVTCLHTHVAYLCTPALQAAVTRLFNAGSWFDVMCDVIALRTRHARSSTYTGARKRLVTFISLWKTGNKRVAYCSARVTSSRGVTVIRRRTINQSVNGRSLEFFTMRISVTSWRHGVCDADWRS